jgi:predicted dienelactone hydrolase
MRASRLAAVSLAGFVIGGLAVPTAVAADVPAASSAATAAQAVQGVQLRLPAPQGRYATGESTFRLVDHTRADPWAPTQPYRELMISVFYPATHSGGHDTTNQFPKAVADAVGPALESNFGLPAGLVDWAATKTHSVADAPMANGRFPVVLYSPGAGDARDWNVSLVEDLASRGYVVVTVDHTGEGPAVRFPDGHVVGNGPLMALAGQADHDGAISQFLENLVKVRVADTRLVLDRLGGLPHRLTAGMDLSRIGMFGQSGGGFTAASTMDVDHRIQAGINMDGTMEYASEADGKHPSEVEQHGLDRPFLLMGSSGAGGSDVHREVSWAAFWQHQRGWKADVTLLNSEHASYTDAEALLPQLAGQVPDATLIGAIGTADAKRARTAVTADRAVVASFFDRFLKGCDDHLLDGGQTGYPISVER